MKPLEVTFGLSHESRRKIVRMLDSGSRRHLELCDGLDISPPEVTRHCNMLVGLGIIRKDSKSMYRLTGTGQHILVQMDNMEFLNVNRMFFEEHDFDMIPKELDTISVFRKASMIHGTLKVLENLLAVNREALDSINCIFEETIDSIVMEQAEQLNRGLRLNILVKEGGRIPHEYLEKEMLKLEVREIPEIPLGMIAAESRSIIIPRHRRGILDYGFGITGQDEFLRYCDSIFAHFWGHGKRVIL